MFKGREVEAKMRKMSVSKVPKLKSKQGYATHGYDDEDDTDDDEEVNGGRFNFIKSMKHLGHEIAHGVKKAGIQKLSKEIADVGVNQLKKIGTNLLSSAETVAPEVAEEGAEVAPLALAAGMKKKRTRRLSQREMNRHALIRKLMAKYGCTLAEASRYIKENNLQY
eukprot:scaffold5684_cov217-Ochromonas_danica.AAC.2